MEMMRACASFRQLAPFNAMLIHMQRPGARLVLTEREWLGKHGRRIRQTAASIKPNGNAGSREPSLWQNTE